MLSKPELKRLLEIARGRSDESLHLLEGQKAVRDALEAGVVVELYARDDAAGPLVDAVREAASHAGLAIRSGSKKDFDRLAQTVSPQPVLALVKDTGAPLVDVVSRDGLLLWLDGIQDPGNVGAIFRIAAAFGAAGVLVGAGSADPLGLKALRASAGLALRVPFARAAPDAIAHLVSTRTVYALESGGEDVGTAGAAPADPVLVLGSEGRGVGAEAQGVATRRIGIPIQEGVESLNVAVAAGIAVWSLSRGAPRD